MWNKFSDECRIFRMNCSLMVKGCAASSSLQWLESCIERQCKMPVYVKKVKLQQELCFKQMISRENWWLIFIVIFWKYSMLPTEIKINNKLLQKLLKMRTHYKIISHAKKKKILNYHQLMELTLIRHSLLKYHW